jgi:hypothetical protein
MPEPRTPEDLELLSAHSGFTAVQDGIEWLEGTGCIPESASAIRLLDMQNDARGREIDRANAVIATVRDELADRIRYAEEMVRLSESVPNARAESWWDERRRTFADALALVEKQLAVFYGEASRYWAVWSEDERLLELLEYDDRPRTEAEARADLREPVVPLTGRLELIDRARLTQLRETFESNNKEQ